MFTGSPQHAVVTAAILLLLGITPLASAATPIEARTAGSTRACRSDCKARLRACIGGAKEERAVKAAACKTGAERRPCRAAQKSTFRRAKKACRSFRASCRACCRKGDAPCAGEEPLFDGTFPAPDRRALDTLPLPPGPNGTGFTWLATADGAIVIDPARRTPVSAAAECAAFVVACYRAGVRNWAGCFDNAPPCPSDTPFLEDGVLCCPSACATRYQELRQSGLDGPRAVTRAIWGAPSCIPGLAGRAGGAAP